MRPTNLAGGRLKEFLLDCCRFEIDRRGKEIDYTSRAKSHCVRVEKEIRRLRAVQNSLERKAACRCKTLRDCERLLAREGRSEIVR